MENPEVQNAIKLVNVKIISVNYHSEDFFDRSISNELEVNIEYGTSFNDDEPNHYIVEFEINIVDEEKNIKISLKAIALFKTQKKIDDKFRNSKFAHQNSPAIAFPFIRSFVSTFTTNAGIEPIILPSFNFAKSTPVDNKNENASD